MTGHNPADSDAPEEIAKLREEETARHRELNDRVNAAQLSGSQAFDVMRRFLETYNARMSTEEVSILLSSSGRSGDQFHLPVDVALYFDWLEAIQQVQNGDLAQ